jgi:hypothetical protein
MFTFFKKPELKQLQILQKKNIVASYFYNLIQDARTV